ncbi:hypothetical protein ACFRAQ_24440 [Nocardia sp. NPDC056611]|uniref:hypothetical protein n=1 Tax=Nocardia sp. NPDC056611 TaxID=3345877 RepID=UPI00366B759F
MTSTPTRHARPAGEFDLMDFVLTALGNLLVGLLTAVFVTLWWALLFPMVSLPIGAALTAGFLLGWPAGVVVAALGFAGLGLWLALRPDSFRRWVTDRARVRFLRWFRYRRRWARMLTACKLTEGDAGALYVPRLRTVTIGDTIDRVRVRMLPGQSPEDYHTRVVRLAHAFGARECRAIDAGPALVELVFRHGDSLAEPITLPVDAWRTLPSHRKTRKDAA